MMDDEFGIPVSEARCVSSPTVRKGATRMRNADSEILKFETSKLRNYPELFFHPYLPYLTDRRSLSGWRDKKMDSGRK